jgi:streptomycin 6-kinase
MVALVLPRNLVEAAEPSQWHGGWIEQLPATVAGLRRRWSLTLGEPFQPGGAAAWVAPARDDTGRDLVVKVAWRHPEADHEADGLRLWNGRGTVKLYVCEQVDDNTTALLLERCAPGTPLASWPEPEQDAVIAGLLRRLWLDPPTGHPFRPLQAMCDMWADEFDEKYVTGDVTLDPGIVRDGIALFRTLPATSQRDVLLCTDLHAGNVLAAQREQWLVIDPKPYVGDPTYDTLQHLLNCDQRLMANPHGLIRRMAELLALDAERLHLWLFARCVQEASTWPFAAELARQLAPA